MTRTFILAMALFLLLGCDSGKQDSNIIQNLAEFPDLNISTRKELFESGLNKGNGDAKSFRDVARFFASNREWLENQNLSRLSDGGVPVSALLNEKADRILTIDGKTCQIRLELFNRQKLGTIKKNCDYAVALDPDMFYPEAQSLPAFFVDGVSGEISDIEIPVVLHSETTDNRVERDQSKNAIHYPVFFVSLEDITESEPGSLSKNTDAQATQTFNRYPYLAFYGLYLKDDNEDGSAEFELYFGDPVGNFVEVEAYADWRFNGVTRNDAAGRSVLFPDVNHKDTQYNAASWIGLQRVDNNLYSHMVPIENDYDAGEIDIDGYTSGGLYPKSVQSFVVSTTSTTTRYWKFHTTARSWTPINYYSDDIYDEAGVASLTEQYLDIELNGLPYFNTDNAPTPLQDINWKLGIEVYPPYLSCGITPAPPAATVGNTYAFYANASGASGSYTYLWKYYRCTGGGEEVAMPTDGSLPPGGCGWTTKSTDYYTSFTPMLGDILTVTVTDTQSGEVVTSTISW